MNTILIILGVIAWCIFGYFVNIYTLKLGDWVQGFGSDTNSNAVRTSIIFSFIFPLFMIMVICFSIFYINNTILDKIAKWHNRSKS